MTFQPIRPVAPRGKLWNTTDLTFESDSVDAEILSANWRAIFGKVNGGLCASDMADATFFENTFVESTHVQCDRGASSAVPILSGDFHNHDGSNSGVLGQGVIGYSELGGKSHGIFWGGSSTHRTLVLFGSMVFEGPLESGGYTTGLYYAIPYDHVTWGNTYLRHKDSGTGVLGQCHVTHTLYFLNGTPPLGVLSQVGTVAVRSATGGNATTIGLHIYNGSSTSISNFRVNWVLVAVQG